jgi:hypothetical protein
MQMVLPLPVINLNSSRVYSIIGLKNVNNYDLMKTLVRHDINKMPIEKA